MGDIFVVISQFSFRSFQLWAFISEGYSRTKTGGLPVLRGSTRGRFNRQQKTSTARMLLISI
jgi:hypothetical protein